MNLSTKKLKSFTDSFMLDQDQDTVTFLEPVPVLTSEGRAVDGSVRGKDNLDQITEVRFK